jgi:hypothetical protein
MSLNPLCSRNSVHWEDPWGKVFPQWWSQHDQVMQDMWHTVCLAVLCLQLGTSLANSLARRQGRQYFSTKPSIVQYQCSTGGSTVEKPAETSIGLASHLVRAPNSRSGGHEFKSPVWQELSAQNNTYWKFLQHHPRTLSKTISKSVKASRRARIAVLIFPPFL